MLGTKEDRQLVQSIPIAITVLLKSPISWSEDNNLALATQQGTYIFEICMTPTEYRPFLVFQRFFHTNPTSPNPYFDTGSNIAEKSVISRHPWKLGVEHPHELDYYSRGEVYSFMMDSILSPTVRTHIEMDPRINRTISPAMPGGDTCHRGYRKASWSSRGMTLNEGCLLCLVTYDHRIQLLQRIGRRWMEVCDVTALWNNYVTTQFHWARNPTHRMAQPLEQHLEKLKMLAIADVIWTSKHKDEVSFEVLIMMTHSGHCVFWKIPVKSKDVKLITVEDMGINSVTASYWLIAQEKSGYLFAGNSCGQLKAFYCSFATDEFIFRDLGYVFPNEDRLSVQFIHVSNKEKGKQQQLLMFSKHNILLATSFIPSPTGLRFGPLSHLTLGRLAISGLVYISSGKVHVSLKEGIIHQVSLHVEEDKTVTMTKEDCMFKNEGSAIIGMAPSPNKCLWAIVESMNVAYDHLVVREPTLINIYQMFDPSSIFKYLQSCPASLYMNADLFESLRLSMIKGENASCVSLKKEQMAASRPLYQRKLYLWLIKMKIASGSSKEEKQELQTLKSKLEAGIIEQKMKETLLRHQSQALPNNEDVRLSLTLICKWLEGKGTAKEKQTVQVLLSKLGDIDDEKCLVCKEDVPMTSLLMGKCSKGHTVPRCSLTLLLTHPSLRCPHCGVFCHPSLRDSTSSGQPVLCIFCDGPFYQDRGGHSREFHSPPTPTEQQQTQVPQKEKVP